MLYLEIDQHARQITISLRDDGGDVVLVHYTPHRAVPNESAGHEDIVLRAHVSGGQ